MSAPYECDPNTGICSGGFGGGGVSFPRRPGNPQEFAWEVSGIPYFQGYGPTGSEDAPQPVSAIAPEPTPLVATKNADGTVTVSHEATPTQSSQPTGQPASVALPSWLIPALIIVAALALGGK